MKTPHNANSSNLFVLNNNKKELKKDRFAKKSILGMTTAGKTSKFENVYNNLLLFIQLNILSLIYKYIFSNQF
tara:strand:- start:164 stop:382 length:219 start_codon:yes stop_codon:yes gene_type:complete